MRERHVSELLAEVFRRGGMKRGVRRAEAVLLWRTLVGPELATFSTALTLRDGVLYVNVGDSETAMHLTLQRHRFIAAFRDRFGVTDVREIRFQVGRLDGAVTGREGPEDAGAAPPPPSAEEVRRLRESLERLGLPADVHEEAFAAGKSLLALQTARRRDGWVPCPTCGALHDGAVRPLTAREAALREAGRKDALVALKRELCAACARYAQEGRVVSAAHALREDPLRALPTLSAEELAVARHLATKALDDALAALLPAAVSDPRLVDRLEATARARLALATLRPPDSFETTDLTALDPRLGPVLALAAGDSPHRDRRGSGAHRHTQEQER